MKKVLSFILIMFLYPAVIFSQIGEGKSVKKQFLYYLRLEKSMLDSAAWTPEKNKIVEDHFAYLQKLLTDGKLILAGRAQVEDEKTFGIVIFEEESYEAAKAIAENDPAVKGKVMTAEVYPYAVALMRGVKSK